MQITSGTSTAQTASPLAELQSPRYTFSFKGQPLSTAFDHFISIAEINVAFSIELLEGRKTNCEITNAGVEQVISCLLDGTNLSYFQLDSGTYVLVEDEKIDRILPEVTRPAEDKIFGQIQGRVVDEESGLPLPNAHVVLDGSETGDITNEKGVFEFAGVEAGLQRLVVSYLGYQKKAHTVDVLANKLQHVELTMQVEAVVASPLIINGENEGLDIDLYSDGYQLSDLLTNSFSQDVVSSVESVMGVQIGEAFADVHVQGGASGEHLFRLDGVPVFVAMSTGGLIGPFSPFAISDVTVHKAGYKAGLGSYLSGVIDFEHDYDYSGDDFDIQMDPMSINARAKGQWEDEEGRKGNWMMSGRKSIWSFYQPKEIEEHLNKWSSTDLLVINTLTPAGSHPYEDIGNPTYVPTFAPLEEADLQLFKTSDFENKINFFDFHGAMQIDLGNLRKLQSSLYVAGNDRGDESVVLGRFSSLNVPDNSSGRLYSFNNGYDWKHLMAQTRYERLLPDNTLFKAQAWLSRFKGVQHFTHDGYAGPITAAALSNNVDNFTFYNISKDSLETLGLNYQDVNEISEAGLQLEFNQQTSRNAFRVIGVEMAWDMSHFLLNLQGNRSFKKWSPKRADINSDQYRLTTYLDARFKVTDALSLEGGFRLSYLNSHNFWYTEPRFSVLYQQNTSFLGPWSFQASWGIYRQFINQFNISSLNRNALVSGMRFWMPVGSSLDPAKSLHSSATLLFVPNNEWEVRFEAYHKLQPTMWLIDYASAALSGDVTKNIFEQEDLLAKAHGFAYGAAASVERSTERYSHSFQYEYSHAERTQPNRFDGRSLTVPWNVPHRISSRVSMKLNEHLSFMARLENKIGMRWAFRSAYYNFLEPNGDLVQLDPYDLSDPTAHKLPMISHLDVGLSLTQPFKNSMLQFRLDLTNVMSYTNVEEWALRRNQTTNTFEKVGRPLTPFLPSIVVRLAF